MVGREMMRARPCETRSRVVICLMVRYWFLSKAGVGGRTTCPEGTIPVFWHNANSAHNYTSSACGLGARRKFELTCLRSTLPSPAFLATSAYMAQLLSDAAASRPSSSRARLRMVQKVEGSLLSWSAPGTSWSSRATRETNIPAIASNTYSKRHQQIYKLGE